MKWLQSPPILGENQSSGQNLNVFDVTTSSGSALGDVVSSNYIVSTPRHSTSYSGANLASMVNPNK